MGVSRGWWCGLRAAAVSVVVGFAAVACTANPPGTPAPSSTPSPAAPPGQLSSLEQGFESTVQHVLPSVVQIRTTAGLGSGVVYDSAGNIVTNAHVVGTARDFQVTLANNNQVRTAHLVASYPPSDLAVIRVDDASGLQPARFGDSSRLRPGEIVLAMGNPLGLSASVTEGIVSAVGRTVSEPQGGEAPGATIVNAIQTSAAINPGNSGGALVDLTGEVIGIPTLAATDPELGGAPAPGIGFAIPSATVTSVADQIIKTGAVTTAGRAALDIVVRTVLSANHQPFGVGVVQVRPGGAADRAGIHGDDVITAINGIPTPTTSDLNQVLGQSKPGDSVQVAITRPDGSTATLPVTLDELR